MIEIEGYVGFEPIGEGGAGVVYRAVRQSTGEQVAVKVLRDVSDRSVAWQGMRRELAALVALGGHPNVVQLLEMIEHQGGPALVMEYASGGSVADLLARRHGVLTVGEAALIGRQAAQALGAAHAAGIVHRDVKPHNLLIDRCGQVKLCDFGIASLTRSDEFGDRTDAWSVRYASPEDLDGDVPVGPPSDVYSLGATLLHLVHGAPPTLAERLTPWVAADTDDRQLAEFDQVLAACLHTDPAARPTAIEVVARLDVVGAWDGRSVRSLVSDVVAAPVTSATHHDSDPSGGLSGDPSGVAQSTLTEWSSFDEPSSALDDDATVRRPGRRSVADPTPAERRRRRWPIVAAVLVSTLVVAVVAALIRPGRGDQRPLSAVAVESAPLPASSLPVPGRSVGSTSAATAVVPATLDVGGPQIVERPTGMVAIDDPSIEWPFGDVGECLVQQPERMVLAAVACSRPHDLQRYAVAELGDDRFPPNAEFDSAIVGAAVAELCAAAFDAVVASHPVVDRLDRPMTRPSAATFEQGDRRFQCLVGAYGHRLIGDARHPGA